MGAGMFEGDPDSNGARRPKGLLSELGKLPTIIAALGVGSAGSLGLVESLDLFGRQATIERMAAVEDHILLLEISLEDCNKHRDQLGDELLRRIP